MKITAEIFKNCLYYIGPGKDFEPLLRFSNQCKYFLYANLYQSKDEVLLYIDQYFQKNDYLQLEEIKVYDDFDELKYFELHPQYHNHLINAVFLNEFERRGYKETFYHALNDKQWMIRIQVLRKDVNRKLTLFYFTGEGLASYIALSQNGQYPPKILCTIQTGALEHPDGIMPKLFEHTRSSPEQWVRGFEGEYGLGLLLGWDNNTLTAEGEFNTVGMDFMFGWNAEGSFIHLNHSNYHTARYCKNFATEGRGVF